MRDSTRREIEANQETILFYYQNHCIRTTASHFHISPMALENWLTEKNLLKASMPSAKKLISKEQLIDLYIIQNKSKQEVAEQLGITIWTISKLFEEYNIHKDVASVVALRQSTCIEKYGVDNPRKAEEVKSKIRTTNLERYGASTFTASEAGKQQVAITKIQHYGDAKYNNVQQGMLTKELKYGSSHYNNREKNRETCLTKYGVVHGGLLPQAKSRSREAACERSSYSGIYKQIFDNRDEAIKFLSAQKYTLIDLMPIFNAPYKQIQQWITRWDLKDYINWVGGRSQYEDQIVEYLRSLNISNIETHNRSICNGFELDIYLPDYKVGIEFNGDYWHSSEKRPPNYHYNKSKGCEQQGIRLIHIYQHQWEDTTKQAILKSIIKNAVGKNSNIIYVRKCELRELNKKDVDLFSNQNSLHGHRNASVYLGLFYRGELVELMSFGKAFFSRDPSIDFECIRSITKIDTTVVGGMNKLFKYFISKWSPHKILYYVDYNTHNGNSMPKLGFKFQSYSKHGIINVATCKEVEDKFGAVFNRKPERNAEIQKYIQEGKILSIYDAGVKKYIWTSPEQ